MTLLEKQKLFLQQYARTLRIGVSCDFAGLNYNSYRRALANDADFAAAVEEIRTQIAVVVDDEIIHRAVEGISEPVFGQLPGRYAGDGKIGEITRYDNKLLMELARALMPSKYGKRMDIRGRIENLNINIDTLTPDKIAGMSTDDLLELRSRFFESPS